MTLEEFFAGADRSAAIFAAVRRALSPLEDLEERVSRSQIAFRRPRAFAWVWIPGRYLCGCTAPLVLTVALATAGRVGALVGRRARARPRRPPPRLL
ncbi:MAG: DUF5655 domain-containing protein [Dehalococcoidia bacterium]